MEGLRGGGRGGLPGNSTDAGRGRAQHKGCSHNSVANAFNISQWNCKGRRNRYYQLSILTTLYRSSTICLQETNYAQNIQEWVIFEKYRSFGRDEDHGVAIFVHNSLSQTEVTLNFTLEGFVCRTRFYNMLMLGQIPTPVH